MSGHERFLDVAGDDPALARMLQESLKRLEEGVGGPQLQEFAREVLAGRAHIRDAVATDAYASALGQRMEEFQQWRQEVGEQEANRVADQAQEYADTLRSESDEPPGG